MLQRVCSKLILIVFTLLLGSYSGSSLADDFDDYGASKRLLVINPLISEIDLTDVEKRLINKVTIKVCAKQRGYQIALGEIGIAKNAGFGISNLEVSILKKPAGIEVKVILLDEIKKQVLGKVLVERVERLHLLRTIESSMDSVFNPRKK